MSHANYGDQTNELFLRLKVFKFVDLVKLKRAQILPKKKKRALPKSILTFFFGGLGEYNFIKEYNFRQYAVCTSKESMYINLFVGGVLDYLES